MSTHPAGRRAAVKAGCNPVHFSLDGCPLSCYFSGSVATTSGHFVHKSERRTRDGAFIYLPPFSETSPIFCSFPFTKIQPVFLPEQTGRKKHRTPFPPSATPAGITHYTLQARSCAKGVPLPPFGNPRFCRSVATVRNPAPVSPPLQNAKKRRRPAQPHGLICAASLFGLRAGTGVLRGLLKCKICVLIMAFCCCVLCRIVV